MISEKQRELLVRRTPCAFAFQREDNGFRGIAGEKGKNFINERTESFLTGEGDGESAVNKGESIVAGVARIGRSDSNI